MKQIETNLSQMNPIEPKRNQRKSNRNQMKSNEIKGNQLKLIETRENQ